MLRTYGWKAISATAYRAAYEKWGGSVITHPRVLDFIHRHKPGIPHEYLCSSGNPGTSTAICRWGRWLAGDLPALNRYVQPELDFGEPEVILPQSPHAIKHYLWLRSRMLSELNHGAVPNTHIVHKAKNFIAQVKPLNELSSKTRNTRSRKLKAWREAGGTVRPLKDFSPAELARIYGELYRKRRGRTLRSEASLTAVYTDLGDMVFGHVLFMRNQPCAYQLILRAESPRWISYEYVNGGMDLAFSEWSPGSILLGVNTQLAWEECCKTGRKMRYSFGRNRGAYKQTWCKALPVFQTVTL